MLVGIRPQRIDDLQNRAAHEMASLWCVCFRTRAPRYRTRIANVTAIAPPMRGPLDVPSGAAFR
jgi:hypothetical protein